MDHAPNALFDLAVNRAAKVTSVLGLAHLEVWHSKTRFAVRVPLEGLRQALLIKPKGECFWSGGTTGQWQYGKANTP